MCYHPIKLPNPKLKSDNPDVKFDKAHDKVYLEVPCGQCGECLSNRMNDYFVRTYQEYTSTVNKGGYVFFDTFTYDVTARSHYHALFFVQKPECDFNILI